MADNLKRIADALDGGDPNVGKPTEEGNLKRIADYIVENGIGGGGSGGAFLVTCSVVHGTHGETTYTLNKTWKEIYDAFTAGVTVIVSKVDGIYWSKDIVSYVGGATDDERTSYSVCFGSGFDVLSLLAYAENDYPTYMST